MATQSVLVKAWSVLILFGALNAIRYGITSYNQEIAYSAFHSFSSSTTMHMIAILCVSVVALLHALFFVMECFFWHIMGPRLIGRMTKEQIEFTRPMAMNQRIYNLGTSFGLFWSAFTSQKATAIMLLLCVIMYATFGAVTVKKSILVGQGLPALVSLIVVALCMDNSCA